MSKPISHTQQLTRLRERVRMLERENGHLLRNNYRLLAAIDRITGFVEPEEEVEDAVWSERGIIPRRNRTPEQRAYIRELLRKRDEAESKGNAGLAAFYSELLA